jgi:hypothetical protein
MIQKSTPETPIEEIHRIRREISDRFGGDIAAIAADADRRAQVSGRPIWHGKTTDRTIPNNADGKSSGDGQSNGDDGISINGESTPVVG